MTCQIQKQLPVELNQIHVKKERLDIKREEETIISVILTDNSYQRSKITKISGVKKLSNLQGTSMDNKVRLKMFNITHK